MKNVSSWTTSLTKAVTAYVKPAKNSTGWLRTTVTAVPYTYDSANVMYDDFNVDYDYTSVTDSIGTQIPTKWVSN